MMSICNLLTPVILYTRSCTEHVNNMFKIIVTHNCRILDRHNDLKFTFKIRWCQACEQAEAYSSRELCSIGIHVEYLEHVSNQSIVRCDCICGLLSLLGRLHSWWQHTIFMATVQQNFGYCTVTALNYVVCPIWLLIYNNVSMSYLRSSLSNRTASPCNIYLLLLRWFRLELLQKFFSMLHFCLHMPSPPAFLLS